MGSDDEIARLCEAGDERASGKLYEEYSRRLRWRISARLGRKLRRYTDTDDIMQSVFRRVHESVLRSAVNARSENEFMGLLDKVAQNTITDRLRRSARWERDQARPDEDSKPSEASPDVLKRIDELVSDPADRAIVYLWLRGRGMRAIAETLSMSHGAVRYRWKRIVVKLAAELSEPE
jgi:RNA polymerase sigma factor (sigma-70 family)